MNTRREMSDGSAAFIPQSKQVRVNRTLEKDLGSFGTLQDESSAPRVAAWMGRNFINLEEIAASSPGLRRTSNLGVQAGSVWPATSTRLRHDCASACVSPPEPFQASSALLVRPRVARSSQPWALFRNPF